MEEELICILHLYYFLLKFTPDPVAKEILVKSSVVLAGSVLLWLSPCYRAGWGRCPPHTESVPWGWGGREANITELPSPGTTESCQDVCVPRECQADGPISEHSSCCLFHSAEISFLRTSQINPRSLCFT